MSDGGGDRLVDGFRLVVFDLDGVIYLIDRPIPGAVEAVGRLRAGGHLVAYATNNASRRSSEVAELLTGMGVPARPEEVLTSAAAAAELLRDRLPAGAAVLVVGADALRAEIRAVGLRPVGRADEEPVAVVQGYGPQVGWAELAEAAVAVRSGATWVATNTDRTLPSPRGPLPGNGALVAALRTALDRDPDLVVGKPEPALFATAARRADGAGALVVGDRLDTDIEGARRAGLPSLLVLTGVHGVVDLLAAPPQARPTYVSVDLAGLFDPDAVVRVPGEPTAGGWSVAVADDALEVSGSGRPLDALAALCALAWSTAEAALLPVRAASPAAERALRALGVPD
ncbi:HAD family hydrolase [Micromonospora echinospora]|uniref:Haloacid Dehalogenase Superfamily Class (Subfamily) IIA/haloacid dehalogenase superfamily, subfamily IA, variant 1 with third motif having Dx(3-4)D or Dx(3-4)E n=1 Tax=Micromonospora echinospora TaxID=1877 RepID=A0A1C5A5M6_MICEC|nr:HAD-IIA family hydrolase [Micromonospora echinospora]OZV75393.1 HAD family hydrolase [Micromonospora echinospora]SCF40522.1 Haloacid Dehalogenase Superfamily Class (subfamily) IIA/haloacid dehalogenase superfamily, subfamily IA, variant 1 with third motif having Dx(3-4)D or Dx(3-4)E [Micromonospora echinospora]